MLRRAAVLTSLAALTALLLTAPTASEAAAEGSSAGAGSVSGRVFFGDQTPPIRKTQVTLDHGVCGAQKTDPRFLISESKGLGNVVVAVQGLAGSRAEETPLVEIEQVDCEYDPHVQAVLTGPEGINLKFRNSDEILHNVHGYVADETVFNFGQPGVLRELDTGLEIEDGVVAVRCDVHEWMSAYVVLFDHPFFAVTDADGNFTIEGLPPGTYTVSAWHEALGTLEKTVQISEGGHASLDFEILPR